LHDRETEIARGSHCKLQTQLEIGNLLGIGEKSLLDQSISLSHEVRKMLFALLNQIKIKCGRHLFSVSLLLCLSPHCPLPLE
jgi:hypothetical protein